MGAKTRSRHGKTVLRLAGPLLALVLMGAAGTAALGIRAEELPLPLIGPGTGIALALIYRCGWRAALGVAVGAAWLHAALGSGWSAALGLGVLTSGAGALGAAALRRQGLDPALTRLRDALLLLAVGVGAAALSAAAGALTAVGLSTELPQVVGLSWIAEAMGVVLLAPPLLAAGWPGVPAVRHLEGGAWIAAAGAFTLAVHGGGLSAPAALAASYAVFPLILAVALRFGAAVTSAAVLAVAAVALGCTALGKGPFAQVGPVADLLSLHAHLAMLGATGLLLAAARSERDRADHRAREHLHTLARAGRLGAVSSLAGGIAHEVSQPLAAANGYAQGAQRMLRAGRPREEVAAALEAVVRGNERAAEVVRRLRAFLRSGAGERERADLNALVGEALELVIPEYRRHRVGLLSDRHPEPLAVWVDPVAIRQVVVNLLQNALEAVVSGEREGLAWVQVTTRRDPGDQWGEVAVADSGPGLPAEGREALFEPLVSGRAEGTGLGLAIVRSLLRAHGGTIEAADAEGGGALLRVHLPLAASRGKRAA